MTIRPDYTKMWEANICKVAYRILNEELLPHFLLFHNLRFLASYRIPPRSGSRARVRVPAD